jgi:hypothetical protein
MTIEWDEKFPLTTVQALPREISDHTPLLLNFGGTSSRGTESLFKFKYGWLLREGFIDMIRDIYNSSTEGDTPIENGKEKFIE